MEAEKLHIIAGLNFIQTEPLYMFWKKIATFDE